MATLHQETGTQRSAAADEAVITRFAPPALASRLEPAGEATMAAFMHMEGACGESWPLGALQIAFVPPGVLPPGGLHTAAGLVITSADHLFIPRCIEQVGASWELRIHFPGPRFQVWGSGSTYARRRPLATWWHPKGGKSGDSDPFRHLSVGAHRPAGSAPHMLGCDTPTLSAVLHGTGAKVADGSLAGISDKPARPVLGSKAQS